MAVDDREGPTKANSKTLLVNPEKGREGEGGEEEKGQEKE
jgi:hypothetical protein